MCTTFAGKQVDFGTLELRANGKIFRLTLMEAELLRHLIRNSGKIVSRKSILEEVWGLREDTDTRAIDNFVVRLAQVHREGPVASPAPADGARRGIPVPALNQPRANFIFHLDLMCPSAAFVIVSWLIRA